MTFFDLARRLDRRLDRLTRRRGALGAPQLRVQRGDDVYTYGDQVTPFHGASIGKLYTTVAVLQLVEEGRIRLGDGIDRHVGSQEIAGLFHADAPAPTILQLLCHESGADDYYEGRSISGPSFREVLRADLDRVWQPSELLDFARERQRPFARPGERFRYSDTGFAVLGRLIEERDGRPYEDAVQTRVLDRAGLADSFLPGWPLRNARLSPCYLGSVDVSQKNALSIGWAGGGVAATPQGFLDFSRALHDGTLVSAAHRGLMGDVRNRVRPGIHYGTGMMELRFGGFSPLLRGLPRVRGHIGSLSTYLFHDEASGTHLALNMHSTSEMARGVRTVISVTQELTR